VEKENLIRIINKYFKGKTLNYKGPIIYGVEMEGDIDFNVEVLGTKKMISVGEYYDFFILKITIVGLNNDLSKLLFGGIPHLVDLSKIINENNFWYFKTQLISYLSDTFYSFDNKSRLTIDDIKIDLQDKKQLTENKRMSRIAIRTIVGDILMEMKKEVENPKTIDISSEDEGSTIYLPNENDFYKFTNLPFEVSVELILLTTTEIESFKITANFIGNEDLIEFYVAFNPKNFYKYTYNLIGELNEIVAHELEHGYQEYYGEYDSDEEYDKIEDPYTYYTLPHEIPAQVKGFKRLSKLRKQPFEMVARNWFDTHQDLHGLNKKQTEKVLSKIITHYNNSKGIVKN